MRDRTPSADACLVCGAPRSPFTSFSYQSNPDLVRRMSTCSGCGYVQIEDPGHDFYRRKSALDELPVGGPRMGSLDKPGREFKIARMALDILGRSGVDVMVYGIGASMDNHHIAKMQRVRHVAIGDIVKLRDDADFHDANLPARKRFAIVIASEVVEHFRDPHEDFANLFKFVERDGLLVCATNVYDGGDLAEDRYPYYTDHTSYYTPRALLEIARSNGYHLDIRTPRKARLKGRKRYLIFTKSPRVLQDVALYFGTHAVAPSEA